MGSARRETGSLFHPGRRRPVRRLVLVVVFALAAVVALTVWLDRSEVEQLELGTPGALTVENTAGPVEVVERDGPVAVRAAASYLVNAPELARVEGGDRAGIRASCPGWGPCRVALLVSVPPGTDVEVTAPDDAVTVGPLGGDVTVTTDGGPVSVGPLRGALTVRTASADVRGADLRSPSVTVESDSGPVDLTLRRVPDQVTVTTGSGPVHLAVPRAPYRLDLQGSPLDQGELRPAVGAVRPAGALTVRAGGPVAIATTSG